MTEAFRLVQDKVRYLSLSIGAGGWLPRAPADVWQARFGDCKDKALLLVSILATMDIEADVVLVHSETGRALPRMMPSPYLFDHGIVRIRSNQGDWFVDPTDVLQGGVGRAIWVGDFAWGLPLSDGSDALVAIKPGVASQAQHDVQQTYKMQEDGDLAAMLEVVLTYRAYAADAER